MREERERGSESERERGREGNILYCLKDSNSPKYQGHDKFD